MTHRFSRSHGIQIFSAPSDAPTVRWSTDLISAGFTAALLGFLIFVAGEKSSFDTNVLQFVGDLPGWVLWLAQAAYIVGVCYGFGLLIGVAFVARGRLKLFRDMVLATLLSITVTVLLTQLIDNRWPELAFFDLSTTRETFPAFFVSTLVAIQTAASAHLTAPMRKIGRTIVLAAVAGSVVGGVTTVSDALGGALVGLFAAAIISYALGTTAGLPSTNRIGAGLADLGVDATDLHYAGDQPMTSLLLEGTAADGTPLIVGVLGRDSWNSRRWFRLWRAAWYRDQGARYGSGRRQQYEHDALAMVLATQRGVSVPALIAVGDSTLDDAILVAERLDHTLADVAVEAIDDDLLDAIWDQLHKLHDAGMSHGAIDSAHVWFDSAGSAALMGFGDAVISATDTQRHEDDAALLVLTALLVGSDRSIAAARRGLTDEQVAAMLPLVQTASLNAELRRRVRQEKLKVGDLRKTTASAIGTETPPLEQLTRVTWKSILMVVFIGFAVYTIVGGLADVGFDTIASALADARWGLVVLALILAASTNFTDASAVAAVSPKPVPIGVTTVEQFAIGFVNMAVPSAAGRVATNARYFQKFGISPVTSTATGAITGLVGFVAQTILVIVTVLAGSGSIDLSSMQGGGKVLRLVGLAVAIFVGVIVVVSVVPAWRSWAWSKISSPLRQVGDALKVVEDPRIAMKALAGSLGTEILYGAAFALCVLAVGGSISLGEAIFINVAVSLFAGLMPIPGGVGVTEAGMTAGLAAIGVPSDIAVSAVLIYRLISYYLPPLWGYACLRWLTREDYL